MVRNYLFQRLKDVPQKQLRFEGERVTWIQASTLTELLDLKAQYPEAKLVVGNTEIGESGGCPAACPGPCVPCWPCVLKKLASPPLPSSSISHMGGDSTSSRGCSQSRGDPC